MNAQQLKNSILQEAIEGRLVPQDPNDEPASVLLDRIRAEKARLVKEGKLKKKELEVKPISEDEIPFEIPESWEWVRLNQIAEIKSSKRVFEKDYVTSGIPFFRSKEIGDLSRGEEIHTELYITNNHYCEIKEKYGVPQKGDIMLTSVGSIGNFWICDGREFYYKDGNVTQICANSNFDSRYVSLFLGSQLFTIQTKTSVSGTAYNALTIIKLKSLLFPLPPLAEQKRIVEKIEELLPKVEKYGKAQEKLNKLNEELPGRLKKSILQEAIEGRLVPQDSNDEPASVLLAKIRKEKEQLVKAGKLKKKDLEESPISEEEIPFEIPDSWEKVKLSFVTSLTEGEKKEGNYVCLDAKYLRGKSTGDILSKGKFVYKNDNIILVDGENSGEVFTVPCDGYMGSTFKQLWVSSAMCLKYVLYFIKTYKDILRNSKKGAAIPHLNKDIFNNLVIGIPPLSEQHHIVEKLEQLLGETDKLKV